MKKVCVFLLLLFVTLDAWAVLVTQDVVEGCDTDLIGITTSDTSTMYAYFTPNQHTCSAGYYLPANIDNCIACPTDATCVGGTYTFNETDSSGAVFPYPFAQTQSNSCVRDLIGINANNVSNLSAIFTPNVHTCSAGYYLPANIDNCIACPSGATCPGGTYTFDEDVSKGVSTSYRFTESKTNSCVRDIIGINANNVSNIYAIFTPKTITCDSGKYINANSIECNQNCPANYYCPGGNYTFSENENSGIYPCLSGTFSPTGSGVCYPHILHVGDNNIYLRSTKLTTPSVNIKIGNDVFYANMTTTPTFMNKSSIRYLRVKYNDTDYYVCDDTTCPE